MSEESNAERPVEALSFEEAMKELEALIERLDRGDLPLDESIRLYQRGALLRSHCLERLRDAEEKVAAITLDSDGALSGLSALDSEA